MGQDVTGACGQLAVQAGGGVGLGAVPKGPTIGTGELGLAPPPPDIEDVPWAEPAPAPAAAGI